LIMVDALSADHARGVEIENVPVEHERKLVALAVCADAAPELGQHRAELGFGREAPLPIAHPETIARFHLAQMDVGEDGSVKHEKNAGTPPCPALLKNGQGFVIRADISCGDGGSHLPTWSGRLVRVVTIDPGRCVADWRVRKRTRARSRRAVDA